MGRSPASSVCLSGSAPTPGSRTSPPHTLRHTFASVAADLGFSELTIAALLGHAARGVTQHYVHIDEALRLAADRVSAEIEALLAGKAAIERRVPAAIGTAGDDRPRMRYRPFRDTIRRHQAGRPAPRPGRRRHRRDRAGRAVWGRCA
ncbi:tyrosine-type recombinase/integrase [Acidiphilium sp.]|uniref:tyrosine-type recombinase/integrase n=1 Tax=Acidiphilium sp. TaxID=527 RepID=UPI0025839B73|nr:tyrosine-type recombinase/integrase [Acidiphilium sp.]